MQGSRRRQRDASGPEEAGRDADGQLGLQSPLSDSARGTLRERAARRQATPEKLALGHRIKEARRRLEMSQTDLAKQLDLTAGAIGQWEVGLAGVSTDTLGRLGSVLGGSVGCLIW